MPIIQYVISLIYPPRCIFCGKVVPTGEIYCEACVGGVNYVDETTDCMKSGTNFIRLISAVIYDVNFKAPIKRLKKKAEKDVIKYMGELLLGIIKKEYSDLTFDFVTTIPMSKEKFKEMGFNHGEVLSEYVSREMGLPHFPHILKKLDGAKAQHELNAKERKLNATKSYIIGDGKTDLTGKVILVIDDIVTTGETLEVCSRLLLDNGAKAVYCATVATGVYKQDKN